MKHLLLALLSAALLPAQFEYGEVLGTIRDASGGVVAGAKITLSSVQTNVERTALSNSQGAYSFPGLRAGLYIVQTELAGFRTARTKELELRTGDHLRIDVQLETGQVTEQVNVEASAPSLQTDSS